jgi:recombination protein RecT
METTTVTTKDLFAREDVRKKFEDMLGKRASQFMTSVLQIAASNEMLKKADPNSILNAAAMAATLDLPLNSNLGFAYIIPYNQKYKDAETQQWKTKQVAQFQIGYKGFKQLALRSGQFKTIHETDVREGEIKVHDRLSGHMEFAWIQNEGERLQKAVVGYVSYFELLNGYSQTFYMPIEKIKQHGQKYSKTYTNENGLWSTDFDGMCRKTVVKLNLSKNAPLSVEMRQAIVTDQSVINNHETEDVTYVDNSDQAKLDPVEQAFMKTKERIKLMIEDATSLEHLEALESQVDLDAEQKKAFDEKWQSLLNPVNHAS